MSEALTPHLTRLQYVRGYLNSLQDEQNNINYNFEANQTFQSSGETLGMALDESRTLSGVPTRQLQPMVALKWKPYVHNSITASLSLSHEELAFAYSAFDLLIPALRKEYPDQTMIEAIMFKGFISGQLQKAKTLQPYDGSRSAAPQVQYPPGQEGSNNIATQTEDDNPLHYRAEKDNQATKADEAKENGKALSPENNFNFGGKRRDVSPNPQTIRRSQQAINKERTTSALSQITEDSFLTAKNATKSVASKKSFRRAGRNLRP